MVRLRAVAEVQPEGVDAGQEQGVQHLGEEEAGPTVATILAWRLRRMRDPAAHGRL